MQSVIRRVIICHYYGPRPAVLKSDWSRAGFRTDFLFPHEDRLPSSYSSTDLNALKQRSVKSENTPRTIFAIYPIGGMRRM